MKETEFKHKEKTALVQKKQQEKKQQLKLDKKIYPHRNHKLWEVNIVTREVLLAQFDVKRDYIYNPNWKPGSTITTESGLIKRPGYEYISALNEATALKKFLNGDNGSKYDKSKAIPLKAF